MRFGRMLGREHKVASPLLGLLFTRRSQDWLKSALACHGACGNEEEYQNTDSVRWREVEGSYSQCSSEIKVQLKL